ncbi:MAG: pilin [Pseudomonadota bacterium]
MAPFKIEVELDIGSGSECPMPEHLIETSGEYVKGITLSFASKDSCVYTCRFRPEKTKLAPYVINYRYDVDEAWTCKTEAGTTLPNKYRPLACKDKI